MNDRDATLILDAIVGLAVVVRDEGPDAVRAAALEVLAAAGGDPVAALTIAAALVDVEAPIDAWWRDRPPALRPRTGTVGLEPCPSHAAYNRHKDRGEPIDAGCETAERIYQRDKARLRRANAKLGRRLHSVAEAS